VGHGQSDADAPAGDHCPFAFQFEVHAFPPCLFD
jgi:hypothetical protein